MNLRCACCGSERELKLINSKLMPGARFISCAECRERGFEPRPLVVLSVRYTDGKDAMRAIKYGLYHGEEIKAAEIL